VVVRREVLLRDLLAEDAVALPDEAEVLGAMPV